MNHLVEVPLSENEFKTEKFGRYLSDMMAKGDHNIRRVDGLKLPHDAQLFRLLNRGGTPYSVILEASKLGTPSEFSEPTEEEEGLINRFKDACRISDNVKKD